ncbi:uncharacterized protein Dyak_GE27489 [Drosophila yakuba]|uniref:Uncharacterized protein n=1 Tax=Drosophila yakuba TaxID=7245 RepID=A0A0R1EB82_DROYA|nr:uncharacterized protein Dyak_GE27489 [Drosophila yakuba]
MPRALAELPDQRSTLLSGDTCEINQNVSLKYKQAKGNQILKQVSSESKNHLCPSFSKCFPGIPFFKFTTVQRFRGIKSVTFLIWSLESRMPTKGDITHGDMQMPRWAWPRACRNKQMRKAKQ